MINKLGFLISTTIVATIALSTPAISLADTKCFLASENGEIIKQMGVCGGRFTPASTFKIPLSLMGYNEKILINESSPQWDYKAGYANDLKQWEQPHDPKLWMKNSCVWYSQVLTQKLGEAKFQNYVNKFEYGNKDISGDSGKNNGLTNSWLSSSLKIAPKEQLMFVNKLITYQLPVNNTAIDKTKKILFVENLSTGWKLHGKTGNGFLLNADKIVDKNRQVGWFIGWIENGNRTISFVNLIVDDNKNETYASLRAKDAAKDILSDLVLVDNNKSP